MDDKIKVNDTIEQLSFEDMPINEDEFVPINSVQLSKSLYEYAKYVDEADIPKFYSDFKNLMVKYTIKDPMMNIQQENLLRARIRQLLFEDIDPADLVADEDEEYQRQLAKAASQDDKQTYEKIASAVGAAGPSGVKRIEGAAIGKLKFILKDMTTEEVEDMKKNAAKDYISYLKTSKVLSDDEMKLLDDNLEMVMGLDGYRDFLRKYILAAARKKGVKL